MARYYGNIAYGETVEIRPGVYDQHITKRQHKGEVNKLARSLRGGDAINGSITVQNTISIIADAFALEHFFDIKYVEWLGQKWTVTKVEVERPRLLLTLGEVYNGPEA